MAGNFRVSDGIVKATERSNLSISHFRALISVKGLSLYFLCLPNLKQFSILANEISIRWVTNRFFQLRMALLHEKQQGRK